MGKRKSKEENLERSCSRLQGISLVTQPTLLCHTPFSGAVGCGKEQVVLFHHTGYAIQVGGSYYWVGEDFKIICIGFCPTVNNLASFVCCYCCWDRSNMRKKYLLEDVYRIFCYLFPSYWTDYWQRSVWVNGNGWLSQLLFNPKSPPAPWSPLLQHARLPLFPQALEFAQSHIP